MNRKRSKKVSRKRSKKVSRKRSKKINNKKSTKMRMINMDNLFDNPKVMDMINMNPMNMNPMNMNPFQHNPIHSIRDELISKVNILRCEYLIKAIDTLKSKEISKILRRTIQDNKNYVRILEEYKRDAEELMRSSKELSPVSPIFPFMMKKNCLDKSNQYYLAEMENLVYHF